MQMNRAFCTVNSRNKKPFEICFLGRKKVDTTVRFEPQGVALNKAEINPE